MRSLFPFVRLGSLGGVVVAVLLVLSGNTFAQFAPDPFGGVPFPRGRLRAPRPPVRDPQRPTTPPAPLEVEGGVVVAFLNLDRSPVGTLVEAKLRSKKIVNWWPRGATARLLDDMELSTALDVPPPLENSGTLALPDALILCRTRVQQQERLAEIIVCEPGLALRLGAVRLTLSKEVGADVGKLAESTVKALSKLGEPMKELWGVPPLRSKDLGSKHESLRTSLAAMVEEELLRRKGAFAVELDYAHAIALARQHAGLTEPVKRPTPIYLMGLFRNSAEGEKRTLAITLQVAGGGVDLPEALPSKGLPPAEAEQALRERAKAIASESGGSQDVSEKETAKEISLLGNLAREFQKSGDAAGELAVLEASLLLKPDDFPALQHSLGLLGRQARLHWEDGRSVVAFRQVTEKLPGGGTVTKSVPNEQADTQIQEGLTAMNLYRRGLCRLRDHLNAPPDESGQQRLLSPAELMLVLQGMFVSPDAPRSYQAVILRLSREQRELALQLLRREAKQGSSSSLLVWGESTAQERMQLALRLIVELQEEPQGESRMMSYVLGGVGVHNLKTPEGDLFLRQLAELPNPAVQAALIKIKDLVAKFELPAATPPMPPAAEAEEKDADVRFVPLSLGWKDLPANQPELKAFCELVLAAGKEGDLFCGDGQVLLMKKGETKLLLDARGQGYSFRQTGGYGIAPATACFDGRYAWLPMMSYGKAPRLLVVDPEKEKVTEFKPEDGLPSELPDKNFSPVLAAAPLGPGKVLLAGSFGKSWLGIASFDGEKPAGLKIIHEAQDVPVRNGREQWRNAALTFSPAYMFALSDPGGDKEKPARRILIGRSSADVEAFSHPLLVDPESGKVEVLETRLNPGQACVMTLHEGALYWVQHSASNQMMAAEFMRLGFPDFEPQSLGKQPLPGKGHQLALGMDETGVHVFHDQWLTAKEPGQPLLPLKGNLPARERTSPRYLVRSNHYGWIVLPTNFQKGYAVEFGKKENVEKPAVPEKKPDPEGK